MPKKLSVEITNAVLDAMDRGKERDAIAVFFEITPNTVDNVRVFRNYVVNENHVAIVHALKQKNTIGKEAKAAIMDHYGYKLPDRFQAALEQDDSDEMDQTELQAPAPDCLPILNDIAGQLEQLAVVPSAINTAGQILAASYEQSKKLEEIPGAVNNAGRVLAAIYGQLKTVNEKLEKLQEKQAAIEANQNAQIQRMDQEIEGLRCVARQLKRG